MTKKTIVTYALLTVIGLGTIGTTSVFAQTPTDTQNPMDSLVQKIATKFGLNQSDVQAVFDADREEHHAEMKANFEKQLSQYVTDGKITDAQRQLILQKRAELDAAHEAKKDSATNLTPEERKSQMDAERTSLEAWAKDNGIDMQYLMPQRGKGHGDFRGNHKERPTDVSNTTVTPSTTQ